MAVAPLRLIHANRAPSWTLFGLKWGALGFTVNLLGELITIATAWLAVKLDKVCAHSDGRGNGHGHDASHNSALQRSRNPHNGFLQRFHLTIAAPFTITAVAALAHQPQDYTLES